MLMHRMSSTSDMTASAHCAEASFPCARSAAAYTVSLMMDAIMTASIIICAICAIAMILRFALGLLGSVLLVVVLLSVLVLLGSEGLPKSWT